MSGICAVLAQSAALFTACLSLHVAVWRVRRPTGYRQWLPLLAGLFLVVGPAVAWRLTANDPLAERVAVLLLHASVSTVYIIGYTLVSAFSPSIEILKLLDRAPGGLPRAGIHLPYLNTAIGGNRVLTLVDDGIIHADGDRVRLGPRGQTLASLALFYRHAIGLPDGTGG
jgi:hypothetical protein